MGFALDSMEKNIVHSYPPRGKEPSFSIPCNKQLSSERVLLRCSDFIDNREMYFQVNSL